MHKGIQCSAIRHSSWHISVLVASSCFCFETNEKANAASSGWYIQTYIQYRHTYIYTVCSAYYAAIVGRELTVGSMTSQLLHLCICLDRDLYKKYRRSMNLRDEQLLQFLMNDWINEMKDIRAVQDVLFWGLGAVTFAAYASCARKLYNLFEFLRFVKHQNTKINVAREVHLWGQYEEGVCLKIEHFLLGWQSSQSEGQNKIIIFVNKCI